MAAMMGRSGIGIDRSPAAVFISNGALNLPPGTEIRKAWSRLVETVGPDIQALYATSCHRCRGPATVRYTVIADLLKCPDCGEEFTAADVYKKGRSRRCSDCNAKLPRSPKRFGARAIETSAQCESGCKPAIFRRRGDDADPAAARFFHEYDLGNVRDVGRMDVSCWYPDDRFPSGLKTAELFGRGIRTTSALFSRRNLMAMALLRHAIDKLPQRQWEAMLFCFTAALTSTSLKSQHVEGGGGYLSGMYYIPPVRKERNALASMGRIVSQVARGADEMHSTGNFPPETWVGLGSATDLRVLRDDAIDLAFLDPPYSDKIQFSELNFVWESWLGLVEDWGSEEIVINRVRNKSPKQWRDKMGQVADEVYRVLKPGGHAALTYDDPRHGTWPVLLGEFERAGFETVSAGKPFTVRQHTFVQRRSLSASRADSLTIFRKP